MSDKELGKCYFNGCSKLLQDFPANSIICDDWHSEDGHGHGFYVVKWNSEIKCLDTKSIDYIDSDYVWRGAFNQRKTIVKELDTFLTVSEKKSVCEQLNLSETHNGYYGFFNLKSEVPLSTIKQELNLPEICYRDIRTFEDTIYLFAWMPGHTISLSESLLAQNYCYKVNVDWIREDYSLEGKWVHSKETGVDVEFESRLEFKTERDYGIDITKISETIGNSILICFFDALEKNIAEIKEILQSFYSCSQIP